MPRPATHSCCCLISGSPLFCRFLVMLVVMLLPLLAGEAHGQSYRRDAWYPSGTVYAMFESGNRIFLGGEFRHVAPPTGGASFVDAASGIARGPFPEVHGMVLTAAEDGGGGWFIGGQFDSVQGQPRENLAHLDANGLVTDWRPRANSYVWKLVRRGDAIYAGGEFSLLGGLQRTGLASLEARTGAVLAWDPKLGGWAKDLLLEDTTLVVAGGFWSVGDSARSSVARVGLAGAQATDWSPVLQGYAYCLARRDETVFVGGQFNAGAQYNLAAFDAATGRPAFAVPTPSSSVLSMALRDTVLYFGGDFSSLGNGIQRIKLAAIGASTGALLPWAPRANSTVSCIVATASDILVGGYFNTLSDSSRTGIASLDPVSGGVRAWRCLTDRAIWDVHTSGSSLLLLGQFTYAGAVERRNLVALDRETGRPLAWRADADGRVRALAGSGGRLYAGGSFRHVAGVTRNYLAAIDESGGRVLDWAPNPSNLVSALTATTDLVVAGGTFLNIAGKSAPYLAVLDANTGNEAVAIPRLNGVAYDVSIAGGRLYAGGSFSKAGEAARRNLAAYSLVTGELLPWDPSADSWVNSVVTAGDRVYLGGYFTQIKNTPIRYFADLDSVSGKPGPLRVNLASAPPAIAVMPGRLFVAGAGGYALAEVDVASGTLIDRTPAGSYSIQALAPGNGALHVGGTFLTAWGGVIGHRMLRLAPDSLRIWPVRVATGETTFVAVVGETLDDCDQCLLVNEGRSHELVISGRGPGVMRSQALFGRAETGSWALECRHRDGRLESGRALQVMQSAPAHPRVKVSGRTRVRRDSWSTYFVTVTGDSLRTARGRIEIPLNNVAGWEPLAATPALTASDGHGGLQLYTAPMSIAPRQVVSLGIRIRTSPEVGPFNVVGRWSPFRKEMQP